MKKLDKVVKQLFLPVDSIALSAVLVLFGAFVLIWPEFSTRVLLGAIGVFALVLGAFRLLRYYREGPLADEARVHLTVALCLLVLGLVLLLMPTQLQTIVPFCMGMLLMVGGIIKLQVALELKKMMSSFWNKVLIEAAVCLAMGGVILVNPFAAEMTLIRALGIAMILEGGMDISANLFLRQAKKKADEMLKVTMKAAAAAETKEVKEESVEEDAK